MKTEIETGSLEKAKIADLLVDAIEALSEGIAVYDANNRLVTCNQRYRDMFPLIAELIVPGALWHDLLRAGAERGQYVAAMGREQEWLKERFESGPQYGQTLEIELTGGAVYQVKFGKTRQGGFVVTNTDVSEERQARVVAQEQENILRTVLQTSPLAIVMAKMSDGSILYRSPGTVALLGDKKNALDHYFDPQDREDYINALKLNGSVDDYRINLVDADGRTCATTSWGRLIDFEGETYIVTAIMDLSERQAQEELIRRVMEACPTPIQMTDAETGEVLFTSPETQLLFGKVDQAKTFYAEPDTRKRYLEQLRANGSVTEFKAQYINARGERFWGSVSSRLIRYNGQDVIVSHTRDLTEQLKIEDELA
ncbi:MAG: PAS-domain containing protein, partial [Pseudomonadota bacterium]